MPETSAGSALSQRVAEILEDHASLEGPLLPILHAVQSEFGHVPAEALLQIAEALNISRADIHGVVSFYHDFKDRPGGRHMLKICRAEACQAAGGEAIAEAALARLGLGWHDTTRNGAVTVEPAYCLGLCACSPAMMLDDRPMGRIDADRIVATVEGARA
jgi:formate dehydrogenase subunit gamma